MSLGKHRQIIDQGIVFGSTADGIRNNTNKQWYISGSTITYESSETLYDSGFFALNYSIEDGSTTGDGFDRINESKITFDLYDVMESRIGEEGAEWAEAALESVRNQGLDVFTDYIENTILNYETNTDFYDHYFTYNTPFNSDEKILLSENSFTSNGNVEFVYNFYDENREKTLNSYNTKQLRLLKNAFDLYKPIEKLNPSSTNNTTLISPSVVASLDDISRIKDYVSMYTNMSFDTDGTSAIYDKLKSTGYTSGFMLQSLNASASMSSFYSISNFVDGNNINVFSSPVVDYEIRDFEDFMNDLDLSQMSLSPRVQIYDLDDAEKGFNSTTGIDLPAFFAQAALTGEITNIINDNFRTYQEILNGGGCYQYTLYYEIVKYENGRFLQRFYVPNNENSGINNLVDTQVRFDKGYQYVVYAHKIIVGSKYKYTGAAFDQSLERLQISVETTPSVKMMRVPYFTFEGHMIDSPSMKPDVSIIPYRGVDNKLLFLLNSPIGVYEKMPTIVSPQERDVISRYQKRSFKSIDDPVTYKTDDPPTKFLVYRLDKKPIRYSDFDQRIRTEVSTVTSDTMPAYTYSSSIIDDLEPNKKYYYMFRTSDVHGNVSDVGDIYEVQLISDGGAVYLDMNIVDLERPDPHTQATRKCRRMLQIKPALQQMIFNSEFDSLSSVTEIQDGSPVKPLGVVDDSMWAKEFKIRLTSTKTGRKVDLNVRFNQILSVIKTPPGSNSSFTLTEGETYVEINEESSGFTLTEDETYVEVT
tara:strand:- start:3409 stop:5682 length:2274 start_codon:yes stop_codon:yes gene_type:complete